MSDDVVYEFQSNDDVNEYVGKKVALVDADEPWFGTLPVTQTQEMFGESANHGDDIYILLTILLVFLIFILLLR